MSDRAAAKYAEALGQDALDRQKSERAERHPCCGERIADGHQHALFEAPR